MTARIVAGLYTEGQVASAAVALRSSAEQEPASSIDDAADRAILDRHVDPRLMYVAADLAKAPTVVVIRDGEPVTGPLPWADAFRFMHENQPDSVYAAFVRGWALRLPA